MSKLVIFFVVVIVRRNFFHTIPQFPILAPDICKYPVLILQTPDTSVVSIGLR